MAQEGIVHRAAGRTLSRLLAGIAIVGAATFGMNVAVAGTRTSRAPTMTMNLVPVANTTGEQPPLPPIDAVSHLVMPLYPGAVSTSHQLGGPLSGGFITWYEKAAHSFYIVNGRRSTVQAWYFRQLQKRSYRQLGQSLGTKADEYTFLPARQLPTKYIEVCLTFLAMGKGRTWVGYWAYDIATPPRPAWSFMPRDVVEVDGVVNKTSAVRLTDKATITALVHSLNSLLTIRRGPMTDNPGVGTASLNFVTATGKSIPVTISPIGTVVDHVALQDTGGIVWDAIMQATSAK